MITALQTNDRYCTSSLIRITADNSKSFNIFIHFITMSSGPRRRVYWPWNLCIDGDLLRCRYHTHLVALNDSAKELMNLKVIRKIVVSCLCLQNYSVHAEQIFPRRHAMCCLTTFHQASIPYNEHYRALRPAHCLALMLLCKSYLLGSQ